MINLDQRLTIENIKQLQFDDVLLDEVSHRLCLVDIPSEPATSKNLIAHTNFIAIQIIISLKKKIIDGNKANQLLNKVDALFDAADMIGIDSVILKCNIEIVQEELGIPHFNKLGIVCDDLYQSINPLYVVDKNDRD